MEIVTAFNFNESVFSKTLNRKVIVSNIKLETFGKISRRKYDGEYELVGKQCRESYEVKYRDPKNNRLMNYIWVDVDDLERI